jgi:uncharacterized protein with PIN domain
VPPPRGTGGVRLHVAEELRFFLPAPRRAAVVDVGHDGTSTAGHLVESVGIPLTEVGAISAAGREVGPSYQPAAGDELVIRPVARPQPVPVSPPRFVLDVHLGALARLLRLLGVDCAYRNDAADDELVAEANASRAVLLTRDRKLLQRRKLWLGAYVRGSRPEQQLRDVLDRFAPPLAPWSRCMACNALLVPVAKGEVQDRLQPGTRRTYNEFSCCPGCGRVYWRGAHSRRLQRIVAAATSLAP